MTFLHITSPIEVLDNWDFFKEGLTVISQKCNDPLDEAMMLKVLIFLSDQRKVGYICIVFDDQHEPQGFCVFEEATPLFAPERSFIARAFYHKSGNVQISVALMEHFEAWAKAQGIKRYIVTTRRNSGAAIRCFQSPRYGFTRGYTTFEKVIT